MKIYLDSSFLVSVYIADSHSTAAAALLAQTSGSLITSTLGEAEVVGAMELYVFRKQLKRPEIDNGRAAFEQDISSGVIRLLDVDQHTFSLTRQLTLQHAAHVGARTADILHVAAALQTAADRFFTFDLRQRELAHRVKLSTN